jgi:chaperonin cofactor prefoldin
LRHFEGLCASRRNEEIATLKEELQEQCRIALEAQRQAQAAAEELSQARRLAAATERERSSLEQKLSEMQSVEDEYDR